MRLLLTSGMGASGALIRFYCWSWAAHAALLLDDGSVLDATPSRGVAIHPPDTYAHQEVFEIAAPDVVVDLAEIWAKAQAVAGKRYDWTAIYGMAARRDWHDPGAWFCSELVAAAFEAAAFPLLRADHLNRVTPRDLLLSPYLRPVPQHT